MKEVAMAVPLLCCAVDVLNVPSKRQVIVAGPRYAPDTDALLAASHATFDPDKVVSVVHLFILSGREVLCSHSD
jgi:hypothetical protein